MRSRTEGSLQGQRLVVVGGRSGIARGLTEAALGQGAEVVLAGRAGAAASLPQGASWIDVDLREEETIATLVSEAGTVDHWVVSASSPANGPLADLPADGIRAALDAKVVGPLLLAKHAVASTREGGSMLLFSGVVGWRPSPGLTVMATANAAVAALVAALAVEVAPMRVNAISPGIVDSGAWDRLGAEKEAFLRRTAQQLPVGRVGEVEDIVSAALLALTNPFLTGSTLHVDGGGRWRP